MSNAFKTSENRLNDSYFPQIDVDGLKLKIFKGFQFIEVVGLGKLQLLLTNKSSSGLEPGGRGA